MKERPSSTRAPLCASPRAQHHHHPGAAARHARSPGISMPGEFRGRHPPVFLQKRHHVRAQTLYGRARLGCDRPHQRGVGHEPPAAEIIRHHDFYGIIGQGEAFQYRCENAARARGITRQAGLALHGDADVRPLFSRGESGQRSGQPSAYDQYVRSYFFHDSSEHQATG